MIRVAESADDARARRRHAAAERSRARQHGRTWTPPMPVGVTEAEIAAIAGPVIR